MKHLNFFILFIFFGLHSAQAEVRDRDISGVKLMSADLASWWKSLPEPRPASVSLAWVKVASDIDPALAPLAESVIISELSKIQEIVKVVACFECRTPRVNIKDDQLVVTKGIPDRATLLDLAKAVPTESFLEVDISRNGDSLLTAITLTHMPSGEVVGSELIRIPDSATVVRRFELNVRAGARFEINKISGVKVVSPVPIFAEVMILDQITPSTKAGISAGAMIFPSSGSYGYAMPTLAWRIQLGRTAMSLMPLVQVGMGLREGPANQIATATDFQLIVIGGAAAVGLDFYITNNIFIGGAANGFFPLHNFEKNKMGLFGGAHLGVAFGL